MTLREWLISGCKIDFDTWKLIITIKPKEEVAIAMDKAELKGFGKPDDVRDFPKGRLKLVKIGGANIGRGGP